MQSYLSYPSPTSVASNINKSIIIVKWRMAQPIGSKLRFWSITFLIFRVRSKLKRRSALHFGLTHFVTMLTSSVPSTVLKTRVGCKVDSFLQKRPHFPSHPLQSTTKPWPIAAATKHTLNSSPACIPIPRPNAIIRRAWFATGSSATLSAITQSNRHHRPPRAISPKASPLPQPRLTKNYWLSLWYEVKVSNIGCISIIIIFIIQIIVDQFGQCRHHNPASYTTTHYRTWIYIIKRFVVVFRTIGALQRHNNQSKERLMCKT